MRAGETLGTRAFVLLEGEGAGPNVLLPDQPHPKWLSIALAGSTAAASLEPDPEKVAARSLDKQFLRNVYSLRVPGTTLVVTDASVNRRHARLISRT